MARLPRLVVPGALHHLLQRSNNRQLLFIDDADYMAYLAALREATRLHGVQVHAYALLPHHVHLLVTPQTETALARAMQTLGRRYVGYFNRRHERSGTLWEGRFRTTLADADAYWQALLCYVEQHALRSGLAERPGDYPWSSAAHHLGQRRDPLISEHPRVWAQGNTPFERELAHRQALGTPLPADLMAQIRRHVHSGWPLLTDASAQALAKETRRPLRVRSPGRPRLQASLSPNKPIGD